MMRIRQAETMPRIYACIAYGMYASLMECAGLSKARNTPIGSAMMRGVSGGERKRTNIAIEMLSNPSLVFLGRRPHPPELILTNQPSPLPRFPNHRLSNPHANECSTQLTRVAIHFLLLLQSFSSFDFVF